MKTGRRTLKKVLGLVLCLAMMLSIMVVGAGAVFADQKDIDTKHQEAVDACSTLNIITGFENGKFMPNDNVTREQMAKMICVLDNGGKEPQLAAGNTFTDVPSDRWSNKYIEACAARGVVVGIGGGKFSPAGKVTATQAAKMLLVELGYDDGIQKYSGSNWATQVNIDATKKGYYDELEDIDVNAPLTREHAAQMIWNALQANEVEYKYTLVTNPDGSITSKVDVKDKDAKAENADGLQLVEDKYGTRVEKAIVDSATSNSKGFIANLNNTRTGLTKLANDPTEFVGKAVKVLAKASDDVYGIYVDTDLTANVVETTLGDISGDLNKTELKINDVTYKTSGSSFGAVKAVSVTGKALDASAPATLAAVANSPATDKVSPAAKVVLIDNTGDEKIDIAVITPVAFGEISYLTSDKISVKSNVLNNIDLEDCNVYSGAAKDDYVAVIPKAFVAADENVVTQLEKVNGEVDALRIGSARIDGTWYDTSIVEPTLKEKGDFYMYNGYIAKTDTASGSIADTAYVIVATSGMDPDGNYQAKVMLDGAAQVVPYKESDSVKLGDKDMYVTYEVEDGVYTFTKITDNNTAPKGFIYGTTQSYKDKKLYQDNNGGGTPYIIDSDAVFYVKYKTDKYERVTGSTVAGWGENVKDFTAIANGNTNIVLTKEDNGMTVVKGGAINLGTLSMPTADTTYGVIVSKVSAVKDNKYEFTIWNGKDYIDDVQTSTSGLYRYDLVEYQANTDGTYSVTPLKHASDRVSITGYNSGSGDIVFGDANAPTTTNAGYVVDKDDTQLIFVNTDPDVDVKESGILGESVAVSAKPDGTHYNVNALYYKEAGTSSDLDVLVIDTANNTYGKTGATPAPNTVSVNINNAKVAFTGYNGLHWVFTANKSTYTVGDTVEITGSVYQGNSTTPIAIRRGYTYSLPLTGGAENAVATVEVTEANKTSVVFKYTATPADAGKTLTAGSGVTATPANA